MRRRIYIIHPGYLTDENGKQTFLSYQQLIAKWKLDPDDCRLAFNIDRKVREEAVHVYPSRISADGK